ncbi:MAG: hypothetical protein V7L31_23030 [Nostoc sp.]|uniref:hypothetical protein n=1 Tax=Nostoc sp. TaxID=1180 RepID=UPI002FF22277
MVKVTVKETTELALELGYTLKKVRLGYTLIDGDSKPQYSYRHLADTFSKLAEIALDRRIASIKPVDIDEMAVITDEQKYAEMEAFSAQVDKEAEEKWNEYCEEVRYENEEGEAIQLEEKDLPEGATDFFLPECEFANTSVCDDLEDGCSVGSEHPQAKEVYKVWSDWEDSVGEITYAIASICPAYTYCDHCDSEHELPIGFNDCREVQQSLDIPLDERQQRILDDHYDLLGRLADTNKEDGEQMLKDFVAEGETCARCGGSGKLRQEKYSWNKGVKTIHPWHSTCVNCHGKGKA